MEKTKEVRAYLSLQKKLFILKYAQKIKPVSKVLIVFNVPKSTYFKWKKAYDKDGEMDFLLMKNVHQSDS